MCLTVQEASFSLPPVLDLLQATKLHEALLGALAAGQAVCLDGTEVERLTTPAAQVLMAAGAEAARRHLAFSLRNPSAALASGFTCLGLEQTLVEWSETQ